jgi:hypothetical protein
MRRGKRDWGERRNVLSDFVDEGDEYAQIVGIEEDS